MNLISLMKIVSPPQVVPQEDQTLDLQQVVHKKKLTDDNDDE
jgi:hypothetical protein